jgi:hypothetical protein
MFTSAALISAGFIRLLPALLVAPCNLTPRGRKYQFGLCLLALLHYWAKSALLLNFFSLYNQSGKWSAQTFSNGLSRIQIRASLSAFQKPNIGLMEAGLFRQSRPAKSLGFAIFLHYRGEGVGQFQGNALHLLKMPCPA